MNRKIVCAGALALALLMAGCQQAPPPAPKVDVQAEIAKLKETDAAWLKAVQAKDAVTAASFYAETGRMLPAGAVAAVGKEAIQKSWSEMFQLPAFALTWENTDVEVSASGDMAYVIGKFDMSMKDAKGKPVTDKGKFVEVWKKQAEGNWKVVVDIFNSDPPPPAQKK